MEMFDLEKKKIEELIANISEDVEVLYQHGQSIPFVEKNVKQIQALVNILKIECTDCEKVGE